MQQLYKISLFAFCFFTLQNVTAQTISQQQTQGTTALVNGGQVFTATKDGFITQLNILVAQPAENRQLKIFNESQTSEKGKPFYEQEVTLQSGWNEIRLEQPFQIKKGQQYAFLLSGTVVFYGHFGNIYSAGRAVNNGILTASRTDLAFEIFEVTEE